LSRDCQLEKRELRSHNKVRALFAENKVRFARAEQLCRTPKINILGQGFRHYEHYRQTAVIIRVIMTPQIENSLPQQNKFANFNEFSKIKKKFVKIHTKIS